MAEMSKQSADTVAGECRLWDFLASNYWRCLCGRAYRRDTNEPVPAMDDRSGPLRHSDGEDHTDG